MQERPPEKNLKEPLVSNKSASDKKEKPSSGWFDCLPFLGKKKPLLDVDQKEQAPSIQYKKSST